MLRYILEIGTFLACGAAACSFRSPMIAAAFPSFHEVAPIVISLIIIEGLLSVDNMLAIAALASKLPGGQKKKALRLGLAGAYVFRLVALFFAGFIMNNGWVKFLGAFYLIHLMADHFSQAGDEEDAGDETKRPKIRAFWPTVMSIQFMDLSLSVDNVVAAVAMSPDIRVVCLGVFLGLLTLWLFASVSLKLVERFPVLQDTAFLLIGYVGVILLVEMCARHFFHVALHVTALEKFAGIAVITALSLLYDRSPAVQRVCQPFFRAMRWPVKAYSAVGGAIIGALVWPFKALARAFS